MLGLFCFHFSEELLQNFAQVVWTHTVLRSTVIFLFSHRFSIFFTPSPVALLVFFTCVFFAQFHPVARRQVRVLSREKVKNLGLQNLQT